MIELTAVHGVATVQDGGRPGRMHEGIPPGGPLVPELHAAANLAVGNLPDAAALEVVGRLVVRAITPLHLAQDTGAPRAMAPGEEHEIGSRSAARVSYLAVRGGIDVPLCCGGRGTLLSAGLGGHHGRTLRAGDRLPIGPATAAATAATRPDLERLLDATRPFAVVAGPDTARFAPGALARLLAADLVVSPLADRTGARLIPPEAARPITQDPGAGVSAPMVRGAMQVTPSGELIVLGPDHPTLGGYPVIAVVRRADHGALAARPPGARVRLILAG